jgi:hypothetical protein
VYDPKLVNDRLLLGMKGTFSELELSILAPALSRSIAMMAPVFLRQQGARAPRQARHDNTIDAALELTHVDVLWIRQRVENRVRFGRIEQQHVIDRHWRVVSFAPDRIFAFPRWASNAYGTLQSRVDILHAVAPGEGYITVADVHPGGDSLLHISGWPRVEKVLQPIEVVESPAIDPADVAPDYRRHVHNACPPVIGPNLTHGHDITPGCGGSG